MTQAERLLQEGKYDQQLEETLENEATQEPAMTPEQESDVATNQDEATPTVPSKRPASSVSDPSGRVSKEAPFELLSPDSPELAEIRYSILIISLVKSNGIPTYP